MAQQLITEHAMAARNVSCGESYHSHMQFSSYFATTEMRTNITVQPDTSKVTEITALSLFVVLLILMKRVCLYNKE